MELTNIPIAKALISHLDELNDLNDALSNDVIEVKIKSGGTLIYSWNSVDCDKEVLKLETSLYVVNCKRRIKELIEQTEKAIEGIK